jgi:hypothetical protein
MSQDKEVLADRARKAARTAHDDLRVLYHTVKSRSDAPMLAAVGANLDGLVMKLDSLSTSMAALSKGLAHDVLDAQMTADVKLCLGIVYDMKALARRLWFMNPLNSPEPEMIMDENEGGNILNMIKRYKGAVSAVLSHHQLCVRQMNHITTLY